MGGALDESPKAGKPSTDYSEWQEEKKHWISAAGVSTPLELALKMESLSKAAAKNSVDLQKLARHLTEVKAFLVELRELESEASIRRKSRDQSSKGGTRKRNRSECRIIKLLESSGSIDESSRHEEQHAGRTAESLLDPHIMESFATLTKSSTSRRVRHVVSTAK